MPSAREVALDCLVACEKQGAWSDGYLKNAMRKAGLDSRDAGLCTRLTFGVVQYRMLLDWYIDRFSSVKTDKMEPPVKNALRLGLYQMLFMDRVPVHAAVNESVEMCKRRSRSPRTPGLVNAVLHAVLRQGKDALPQPDDLATRYSHPQWLVDAFAQMLPAQEVEALLAAHNTPVPTMAQTNTLKTTPEALLAELTAAGVEAQPHPWLPQCLTLRDTGAQEELEAFQRGEYYIQDTAARLAILAAAPKPGMTVLDACAAPGGKSFVAAIEMGDRGSILACDIHPHKQKLIEAGAKRLGLTCISTAVMDAKSYAPELEERFDLVIADVPCSGLGIIRKKPDIRYKDPGPLKGLPQVQLAILNNVSRYVKPGGTLLYATCTLLPRENQDVVAQFLRHHGQSYSLAPIDGLPGEIDGSSGMVTLWPHRHGTDGFFFAKLLRR